MASGLKAVSVAVLIALALSIPVWGKRGQAAPPPPVAAPSEPTGRVLALHAEPAGAYVPWFSSSLPDDGERVFISRIRGDAFSRFYYLVTDDTTEVRSEEGRLLARIVRDEDILGVRKTSTSLALFQYHAGGDKPPRYDLTLIERGAARVYRCRLDPATLEAMTGRRDMAYRRPVDDASVQVVRSLEEANPALARDHCAAIGNGVRRGRDAAPRPVLTKAFPRVGDRLVPDERGLKGGWLYQGMDQFGPARRDCCAFTFEGDGGIAVVITGKWAGGYRVRQILHIDDFARNSMRCEIDGAQAVIAVADAAWKNGRAYFVDGKTLRIVRWTDRAPPQCQAS
jgi:hypothetical protein